MVLLRQCEERLVLRRYVCLQRSSVCDRERKLHFSGLSSCPRRSRHRVALHRSVIWSDCMLQVKVTLIIAQQL